MQHLYQLRMQLADWSRDAFAGSLLVLFAFIGAVIFLRSLFAAARAVWVFFLRPGKNLKANLGQWAVITGCTDGIGKAYAEALAASRFNLVLIGRNTDKLQALSDQLTTQSAGQCRIIAVDFASADEKSWQSVAETVADIEVGLLINSAGMSYDHAEYFEAVSEADIAAMIQVNIVAVTRLCSIVVPQMKSRRRGAIINIGSGSATYLPSYPLYAVYAATKAYVDELSRDLAAELAAFGVTVENQAPFFVATKMSKIRKPRLDAPSPKTWVAAGLKQIGYQSTSSPYWVHAATATVVAMIPPLYFNAYVLRMHKDLRRRWLQKHR